MKYNEWKEKVKELYIKTQVKFWKRIYKELNKTSKNRRRVNIFKINRYAKDNETIFVPGKVLSMGEIHKKINLIAFEYSKPALEKLKKAKINIIDFEEFMKKNPKAKGVRIIG